MFKKSSKTRHKSITNHLRRIDGTTGNANSADNAGQNSDAEQEDEVEAMAEMISDLVVKKLSRWKNKLMIYFYLCIK